MFLRHYILELDRQFQKDRWDQRGLLDDDALIAAVAKGDMDPLGVLYERHSAMVKRALRRTAPEMPADEADDLTQDVFILLSTKAEHYQHQAKAKAYLYGIAVKKASTWRRNTWLRRKLLAEEQQARSVVETPFGAAPSESYAMKQSVKQALALLPEKQRTVLLLYTVEGFNGDEIAHILGISKETVRTRLFRARQTILADVHKKRRPAVLRKEAS